MSSKNTIQIPKWMLRMYMKEGDFTKQSFPTGSSVFIHFPFYIEVGEETLAGQDPVTVKISRIPPDYIVDAILEAPNLKALLSTFFGIYKQYQPNAVYFATGKSVEELVDLWFNGLKRDPHFYATLPNKLGIRMRAYYLIQHNLWD